MIAVHAKRPGPRHPGPTHVWRPDPGGSDRPLLPLAAPDEVRLYDTRIDILLSPELSPQLPDAALVRRLALSRSPRRELDAAAIYWAYQHTAPRRLRAPRGDGHPGELTHAQRPCAPGEDTQV